MKLDVVMIRHAQTQGNLRGAYIGRTDEPLCPEGTRLLDEQIARGIYPKVDAVCASDLRRCVETARRIYPGVPLTLCAGLRETDFGVFEGKNYAQLNGNPDYQRWIDSGGTIPFPGGEAPADFRARSVRAFTEWCESVECGSVAIVCHGGTIMAVLDALSRPHRDFYDWQVKNAGGYRFVYDTHCREATDICKLREEGGAG